MDAIEERAAEEEMAPLRAAQAKVANALDRRRAGATPEGGDGVTEGLDEEMEEAGRAVTEELQRKQREMLGSIDMLQYAVGGSDKEWDEGELPARFSSC